MVQPRRCWPPATPASVAGAITREQRSRRSGRSVRKVALTQDRGQPLRIGVRRGITSGRQAAPVTLSYSESGHQPPQLAVPGAPCRGRPGQPGFWEPHRNPTNPRHGGWSPQESHGRNGTLRYTCYACLRHGEQSVSSVDARELGCWSLFQMCALRVIELLIIGRSAVPPCP